MATAHGPQLGTHSLKVSAHSPTAAAHSPHLGAHSPKASRHSPTSAAHGPKDSAHSPRGFAHSPKDSAHSPKDSAHSPKDSAHSPRGFAHSPKDSAHSPRGFAHSPKDSAHSPRGFAHGSKASAHGPIDEAFLCCSLCCRTLHVPKVLPCLHVFCRKCLRTHAEKTKRSVLLADDRVGHTGGMSDHPDSGYSGSGDTHLKPPHNTSTHSLDDADDQSGEAYLAPTPQLTDPAPPPTHSDGEDAYYEIPMNYGAQTELDPKKLEESKVKREKAEAKEKMQRSDTIYENDSDDNCLDNYVTADSLTPQVKRKVALTAKSVTIPHLKPDIHKPKEKNPSTSSLDVIIPAEDLLRKPSNVQYITPDTARPSQDLPDYINLGDIGQASETANTQDQGALYMNADQVRNSKATHKHWTIRNSQNLEDTTEETVYDVPNPMNAVNVYNALDGYLTIDSQNNSMPKTPAPIPPQLETKDDQGQQKKSPGQPPLMKVRQKTQCNGKLSVSTGPGPKHGKAAHKELSREDSGFVSPKSPAPSPYETSDMEHSMPIYEEAAQVICPVSQSFPCPVCDAAIPLPDSGVEEFKTCTLVKTMQDMFVTQKKEKNTCGNCESKTARFKCIECKRYLCGGCRDAHGWRKTTRKHKVMALTESASSTSSKPARETVLPSAHAAHCQLHRRRKASHLCASCDCIICEDCKAADHQGHVCGTMETCADRDRDFLHSLTTVATATKANIESSQEQLKEYSKRCGESKKSLLERLESQKTQLLQAVQLAHGELAKQVEEEYAIEKRKVDRTRKEIANTQRQLDQGVAFSENLLKYGKDGDVVAMMQTLLKSLNTLKQSGTPHLQAKLDMTFTPVTMTTAEVKPLFGELHAAQQQVKAEVAKTLSIPTESSQAPLLSYNFKAKTIRDTKGCKPTGLAVLPNHNLLIVDDINKKVKQFDLQGHLLWECCPEGSHQLVDPWDIAITADHHLAITDRSARCVKIFTKNGDFVCELGGSHLQSAWGIAVNSHGDVIVTDAIQRSVFVYDSAGKLLFSLPNRTHGDPHLFKCPEYVAVNHNDDIIVSDFDKHCILVFDCLGQHLFTFGSRGTGIHQFNVPCGVCVDKDSNILVADYTNQRIVKLNQNGEFLCHLASRKEGLVLPQALSFSQDNHLIVLDRADVKVFRFTAEEVIPQRHSPQVSEMVPLDFEEVGEVEETVYDVPRSGRVPPPVPVPRPGPVPVPVPRPVHTPAPVPRVGQPQAPPTPVNVSPPHGNHGDLQHASSIETTV